MAVYGNLKQSEIVCISPQWWFEAVYGGLQWSAAFRGSFRQSEFVLVVSVSL